NEMMFEGVSEVRAYQRVMKMREMPDPPPPAHADSGSGGEHEPSASRPEAEESRENEKDLNGLFEEFFNEVFGESPPGNDPRGGRRAGHQSGSAPQPPVASSRVKELYRLLVRKLHPDTQKEMTAQKLEWWHQTQTAYEAGDAEQLEVILTLCEIDDSGSTAHTSASLLQRITARLKHSLREIKRQLNE